MTETEGKSGTAPRPLRRRRARAGLWLLLSLVLVAATLGFGVLALTGRPLHLPVWAVAEVEQRMNRSLANSGGALSIGAMDVSVDRDWVPRLRLEDVRLLQPGGAVLLTLPEARIAFAPDALARGQIRAQSVVLSGAHVTMRRRADGTMDLALGAALQGPALDSGGRPGIRAARPVAPATHRGRGADPDVAGRARGPGLAGGRRAADTAKPGRRAGG
jgi:hypothetical protein